MAESSTGIIGSSSNLGGRNDPYGKAVPHCIDGLYSGFHAAVTVLRIARVSLDQIARQIGIANPSTLDDFYSRLVEVERQLYTYESPAYLPFVVVVEGLDGSGKSSVVQELANRMMHDHGRDHDTSHFRRCCLAMATPTESMSAIRPIFDKHGGAVARAFYMVSNYVLQHEIRRQAASSSSSSSSHRHPQVVVLVDRWYASTLAYSVGWKNTSGGPDAIDALYEQDFSLFQWPTRDLDPPDLMLLLQVDSEVRKARVQSRKSSPGATQSDYNPWDDRLNQDEGLGMRIMRAFELLSGPREVVKVDANQSQEEVLQSALAIVQDRVWRHFEPHKYFATDPLSFLCWSSARLGLCDIRTGRRRKHQPWAIQIAMKSQCTSSTSSTQSSCCLPLSAPSLRTVGVHTADRSGVLFFTWGHPGGGSGGCYWNDEDNDNSNVRDHQTIIQPAASMTWVGGDYLHGQQWRAEGVLCRVSPSECELLKLDPPLSLVAQIAACDQEDQNPTELSSPGNTNSSSSDERKQRRERPASHAELVTSLRHQGLNENQIRRLVRGTRFVPLRIEVLIGGPSSPAGPLRFEWTRGHSTASTQNNSDKCFWSCWNAARAILPFTRPFSTSLGLVVRTPARPVTLAITGSHCAGKATIGDKVARILGWSFDPELGQVLRDHVVAGAHKVGYGCGSYSSWDEMIYEEEKKRDDKDGGPRSRVVETWHIGNLAWSHMRSQQKDKEELLMRQSRDAIKEHIQVATVLCVHLSTAPEVAPRRRCRNSSNVERLPMENEADECRELHSALEQRGLELFEAVKQQLNLPGLILDNSEDGELAMNEATRSIVKFVNENLWRTFIL